MDRQELLERIGSLVAQEHELRSRVQAGELSPGEEQDKIRRLEAALDQCWDLLRQRHARRSAGQDPGRVKARPVRDVEDYLQ
ncbi:DUF2630 family protein [Rhodococcus sp. NPDC059968]|uniref:DUF2630 family protein n=1 Tax=Rhodococcus sp. NPDC059968 TaxID=3347017 RepID=UPI00366C7E65